MFMPIGGRINHIPYLLHQNTHTHTYPLHQNTHSRINHAPFPLHQNTHTHTHIHTLHCPGQPVDQLNSRMTPRKNNSAQGTQTSSFLCSWLFGAGVSGAVEGEAVPCWWALMIGAISHVPFAGVHRALCLRSAVVFQFLQCPPAV